MSTRNRLAALVLFFVSPALAADAVAPSLGAPISNDEIAKWDLSVFPSGAGLPPGRGVAKDGAQLFATHCERCHGSAGRGATAEELVGPPAPPSAGHPQKTIGAYWPYATTLFDFIRRSKPPENPGSLSADQVYALSAYLLASNGVIGEADEMTAATLPKVKMPNRDGFVRIDAP